MEPTRLIIIFVIILLASIIKGTTSFGLALIAMPLLSFFLPLKFLVPMVSIFNLLSSAMIIINNPGCRIEKNEIVLPVSGMVGAITGLLFLPILSDDHLKLILSVILAALSIAFLTGYRFRIRNITRARITAGFSSGTLGGLFSISGPLLVLFLTSLNISVSRFRVTFSIYSVMVTSVALAGYFLAGLVTSKVLALSLIMLPALLAGTWFGSLLVKKVPVSLFSKGCIWLTLISGCMIFFSVLLK